MLWPDQRLQHPNIGATAVNCSKSESHSDERCLKDVYVKRSDEPDRRETCARVRQQLNSVSSETDEANSVDVYKEILRRDAGRKTHDARWPRSTRSASPTETSLFPRLFPHEWMSRAQIDLHRPA